MNATKSTGGGSAKGRRVARFLVLAVLLAWGGLAGMTGQVTLQAPLAHAQVRGEVPGGTLGFSGDAQMWRAIRHGVVGTVSIPNKQAGRLVQAHGDNWRAFKNGPLSQFGAWLLLFTIVVLAVFFVIRGRMRIADGFDSQGRTIHRFNEFERGVHWLVASSFIVLALTGLNIAYGRYVLRPIIGPDAFGALTYYGKLAHNFLGFAFIIGLILMFLMWVKDNLPRKVDIEWLKVGGGMFTKEHVVAPAWRFNAGQKILYWIIIIGGASLSVSGIALIFPFHVTPWSGTFAFLDLFGLHLPTHLSPLAETQLSVLWHSAMAMAMIAVVIAHIYIGSLGIEGAFDAVGSGEVDLNWAKDHHNLWVEEELSKQQAAQSQPAE